MAGLPLLRLLFLLSLLASGPVVHAQRLQTPGFSVELKVGCAEGSVSCDRVQARILRRSDGQVISLRGKTLHTLCADGVTPCRFLGYVFSNRGQTYTLHDDGRLVLVRGKVVVAEEKGEWQ